VRSRDGRVWARGRREKNLNDRQIPKFRGVRVHVSTGYNRVEGNQRASLNGLVSDLPPETPNVTIRHFCVAVRPLALSPGLSRAVAAGTRAVHGVGGAARLPSRNAEFVEHFRSINQEVRKSACARRGSSVVHTHTHTHTHTVLSGWSPLRRGVQRQCERERVTGRVCTRAPGEVLFEGIYGVV
jgi:hypothetical protein